MQPKRSFVGGGKRGKSRDTSKSFPRTLSGAQHGGEKLERGKGGGGGAYMSDSGYDGRLRGLKKGKEGRKWRSL